MRAIARRIDRLDGGTGQHKFVLVSIPKEWESGCRQADAEAFARAIGYRNPMTVYAFDHLGDTEPRLIGEGYTKLIETLDEWEAMDIRTTRLRAGEVKQ